MVAVLHLDRNNAGAASKWWFGNRMRNRLSSRLGNRLRNRSGNRSGNSSGNRVGDCVTNRSNHQFC
jgi:hypothetical protein